MRCKPVLIATVLVLGIAAIAARSSAAADADQQFFEKHLTQIVKLKVEPIENPAIGKVLAGTLYNLTLTMSGGENPVTVARLGENLVDVTKPSTDADMPSLQKLIKPDFKLTTDADAHLLQDVLDILYPISDKDDAKVKTIRHAGDEWTFVRGKFLEHFDGFIVTTNPNGSITRIQRSLQIK